MEENGPCDSHQMRFYAAKTKPDKARSGEMASARQSQRRSSPAADRIALLCAAVLLVMALYFHSTQRHLYLAVAIPLAFATAARLMRGVTTSGAFAGAVIAFIAASRDMRLFWVLVAVFFITLAATRAGTARKRHLDMAGDAGGRSASQVISNLGIAGLALALPDVAPAYLLALAALAEVAADTTSSEIGAAFSSRAALITTWKTVPAGTDGGVSLKGTLAGTAAAAITIACITMLGLASALDAIAVACSALVGMFVDSLLGATLEQRGYLDNNMVNLSGTAAAALVMWGLVLLLGYR